MSESLGKSFQIKKYGELSCEEIQYNFCQKYKLGRRKKSLIKKDPQRMEVPLLLVLILIFYAHGWVHQGITEQHKHCEDKKLFWTKKIEEVMVLVSMAPYMTF